jgi:hypothetical protein
MLDACPEFTEYSSHNYGGYLDMFALVCILSLPVFLLFLFRLLTLVSMASVVLITLAASRVHSLRQLITQQVIEIGPHINGLITRWMYIPDDEVSPSVLESTKLIANVSALLKLSWNKD